MIHGTGLEESLDNTEYLRLVCAQFTKNEMLNTLVINLTSVKTFTPDASYHWDDMDQYIGTYFNQYEDTLEFVLYDKTLHLDTIRSEIDNKKLSFTTEIPITIGKYNLNTAQSMYSFVTVERTISLHKFT